MIGWSLSMAATSKSFLRKWRTLFPCSAIVLFAWLFRHAKFLSHSAFALDSCWTIYWYRRITILTYKIYQTYSTHSVPLRQIKLILRCKTIFIECTKWNDEYVVRKFSIIARREKTFVLNWQFNLWYLQLGTGNARCITIPRVFVWTKRTSEKGNSVLHVAARNLATDFPRRFTSDTEAS